MSDKIKLIECPRDAMQGIHSFIDTDKKIRYINTLLKVGFDTLDFGSFVSPKAIPQMRDVKDVVENLDLSNTNTKLSAIVANKRGAIDAAQYECIDYLGYPFSISETFQLRNTNATIDESVERVEDIIEIARAHGKKIIMYVSMGFGNPYGDPWNVEICQQWVDRLADLGIRIIALSDTIGVATPESISYLFDNLIPPYPDVEFGAHLHTHPHNWREKIDAAYNSGCKRFDSTVRGYGGCPMAKDDLVGNMPTENLIYYFDQQEEELGVDRKIFLESMGLATEVFPF